MMKTHTFISLTNTNNVQIKVCFVEFHRFQIVLDTGQRRDSLRKVFMLQESEINRDIVLQTVFASHSLMLGISN